MMSAKLMPAAATLISTSPLFGSGTGASRISSASGGPWRAIHTWRIVAAVVIGISRVFLEAAMLASRQPRSETGGPHELAEHLHLAAPALAHEATEQARSRSPESAGIRR